MTASDYSEDRLVQETTAAFLHDELDWRSAWAWDSETYGPTGTLGRKNQTEVVLTRDLEAALRKLNPGLPDDAYAQGIEQALEGATLGQELILPVDLYPLFF